MANKTILCSLTFAALLSSVAGLEAATIPFFFSGNATITPAADNPATPANPTVHDVNFATITTSLFPTGTILVPDDATTYAYFPGGIFAPVSGGGHFTASFNSGKDTFIGTTSVTTSAPTFTGQGASIVYTITGGTGVFSSATGKLTEAAFVAFTMTGVSESFTGNGQITAPNLTPEPASFSLMIVGLVGLGTIVRRRIT